MPSLSLQSRQLLVMSPLSEYNIDECGDACIVIQNKLFRVSSRKLSALSPTFSNIFANQESAELHEDPEAFCQLLRCAHGIFVPTTSISADILMKLTDMMQRYCIQGDSSVHTLINCCFAVQTLQPAKIRPSDLLKYLTVAKALGKVPKMLLDLFQHGSGKQEVKLQSGDNLCALFLGM